MPRSCAAVWASESYDYAMPSRQPASIPAWTLNPRFGWPVAIVALGGLTVALAPLLGEAEIVAVTMVFLLIVLLVSATWGYAVGLFSAVLADLLLNLFFVPPLHTVAVQEPRNVAALVVFLAVAIVGASMLALLRGQLAVARRSTEELATMLNLSRDLALAATPEGALAVLAQSVSRTVRAKRCDILRLTGGAWVVVVSTGGGNGLNRDEAALANAAIESGRVSRRSTGNQPGRASLLRSRQRPATDTFLPFRTAGGELGVIRILGALTAPRSGDLDALLQAFADEAGVAIHRVRLAEQARQAEALQQSDEFKSVLLSSVSHDLRSPLTAIKAAVGSLRTGDVDWTDEDRDQLLGAIESQADRLTATVADLLEMSRLEGGAIKPTLEPTSIAVIFQDAMVATQAATTGRHLCVDAPEDLWVRADYGLLLQALTNLIENAAKYSTAHGAIELRAEAAKGRVILEVADHGPGIPEVDLPHIFDKFYRGSTGTKVSGTGLGLAIVRAMVELSGGRVTVDSSSSGTRFRISLPPSGPPK